MIAFLALERGNQSPDYHLQTSLQLDTPGQIQ